MDTRAYIHKAQGLVQRGCMAEAYALIKPMLDEQPSNVEMWWLAAYAAPTPQDSIMACEKVLTLKPNYAPARKMLVDQRLKLAEAYVQKGQTSEALMMLNMILKQHPKNVDAWWLAARAAPTSAEAIHACEQVLALQPDHQRARQFLSLKKQDMVSAEAQKQARPQNHKRRTWVTLGLLGITAMLLTGTYITIRLTGITFGIAALAQQMSVKKNIGYLGSQQRGAGVGVDGPGAMPTPITDVNTLPVGGTNEYRFTARANALFLAILSFPATGGTPGNAIELLDPNGYPVPLDKGMNASGKGTAFIQATLPKSGEYILRLKGIAGTAQGTYAIQFGVEDTDEGP